MNDLETTTIVVDPVCGMKVNPSQAAPVEEHEGVSYFFCGKGWRQSSVPIPQSTFSPRKSHRRRS